MSAISGVNPCGREAGYCLSVFQELGGGGEAEETIQRPLLDIDIAIHAQISQVVRLLQLYNDRNSLGGRFSSEYRGQDIGGFVCRGGNRLGRTVVAGHTLSKVNANAARGRIPSPGMFSGQLSEVQKGAEALVVGGPKITIESINRDVGYYHRLSKQLNARVIVISTDFQTFEFFNGELSLYPPTIPE